MTMAAITETTSTRRVATYARVSSEDQAERGTIKTQLDELDRRLGTTAGVEVVGRFTDDGVSGTVPIHERPDGARFMALAAAGGIDEAWVYKVDRLGRDALDLLGIRRRLEQLGIKLVSVVEGEQHALGYDISAVVADYARVEFLRKTADGMERAAREGRYTGGVVVYGMRVKGKKPNAYLVPDESIVWGDRSAADVICWMFERVAIDDWSCKRVADELNTRGVPTHSLIEGTGTRKKGTRGIWRSGRVRNMIVNQVYRGELRFGQRTKKDRQAISASVPALVSPELWQAAQVALARHRICSRHPKRVYPLGGVISCGECGLNYIGSQSNGKTWYRCNGQLTERGPIEGRCTSRNIKGDHLESVVLQDIERFLRHPGDLLSELDGHAEREVQAARIRAEAESLRRRLEELGNERREMVRQRSRGRLTDSELDEELTRIDADRFELERRLDTATPPDVETETMDVGLLEQLRSRLDGGLTPEQWQEVVRLLVGRIIITTIINEDGSKDAKAAINYRLPAVVATRTGRGSWPR